MVAGTVNWNSIKYDYFKHIFTEWWKFMGYEKDKIC